MCSILVGFYISYKLDSGPFCGCLPFFPNESLKIILLFFAQPLHQILPPLSGVPQAEIAVLLSPIFRYTHGLFWSF